MTSRASRAPAHVRGGAARRASPSLVALWIVGGRAGWARRHGRHAGRGARADRRRLARRVLPGDGGHGRGRRPVGLLIGGSARLPRRARSPRPSRRCGAASPAWPPSPTPRRGSPSRRACSSSSVATVGRRRSPRSPCSSSCSSSTTVGLGAAPRSAHDVLTALGARAGSRVWSVQLPGVLAVGRSTGSSWPRRPRWPAPSSASGTAPSAGLGVLLISGDAERPAPSGCGRPRCSARRAAARLRRCSRWPAGCRSRRYGAVGRAGRRTPVRERHAVPARRRRGRRPSSPSAPCSSPCGGSGSRSPTSRRSSCPRPSRVWSDLSTRPATTSSAAVATLRTAGDRVRASASSSALVAALLAARSRCPRRHDRADRRRAGRHAARRAVPAVRPGPRLPARRPSGSSPR